MACKFERTEGAVMSNETNMPPMTKRECVDLSWEIGSLKRCAKTIDNVQVMLKKFEVHSDKPSDSGLLINVGLEGLSMVREHMNRTIEVLDKALKHAKEGK